jgi:hypothetical protein
VGLTIGNAICVKNLNPDAPSNIADSRTELGIASNAFRYIKPENTDAAKGIAKAKTLCGPCNQFSLETILYCPAKRATSGKTNNIRKNPHH